MMLSYQRNAVIWYNSELVEHLNEKLKDENIKYTYSVLTKYWWIMKVLDDVTNNFVLSSTATLCYYKRLSDFVACLGL